MLLLCTGQGFLVYPKYPYCMLVFLHDISPLKEGKDAIRVNQKALLAFSAFRPRPLEDDEGLDDTIEFLIHDLKGFVQLIKGEGMRRHERGIEPLAL